MVIIGRCRKCGYPVEAYDYLSPTCFQKCFCRPFEMDVLVEAFEQGKQQLKQQAADLRRTDKVIKRLHKNAHKPHSRSTPNPNTP